jgi:protein-tyrosine phosphatase
MSKAFSISELTASNGCLGITPLPGRSDAIDADVEAIVAWGASVVVSMTELSEMNEFGSKDLGPLLEARKVDWLHIPVRDFGGLPEQQAQEWPALSARLRRTLKDGGKVLVHCRGGLGRSGMIVLRLLCELGENPEAALLRLRAVRPGAVETAEQMAWAKSGLPTDS